ncbi:M20 family metallopeptidase [Halococcus thailandensis]|uniref:Peptidase M20 n=1 Tax=Halococcus thailandensis JCM 13552 TaxID=1227457 RepID=M0N1Z5_9EURY|nr:M20/M25/M40 family metallo-hydrolase [Halococcus thailandensis]EMA51144.1 peptidase M20 [Halococcus thailandensis JCM 13552]
MSAVTELTRELVAIPSHDDETEAGDFIERWLRRETDATVTRDEIGNVVARRGSGGESLAFVGHHDVVPPDDEQIDGDEYVVEKRDERLHGRGTADMKGAVAAAMCAFRDSEVPRTSKSRAQPDGANPTTELVFASFVGEEIGGEGARHAIENGFAPDYAIVGEGSTGYSAPSVTDVAIAHKGRRASTITAYGTAAHASEPEAGENAIYRAGEAVDTIRGMDGPSAAVFGEDVEGSIVVTEIEGGSAWNVIPESCSVTVDERTVPGERAPLSQVEDENVEWTVDQDLPPMACDDEAFGQRVLAASDGAQNGDPELVTKPHATDAGWLAEAGVTCVVCGPAEPGEAHTKDESVSLDVLDRCYEIYRGAASGGEN